MTNKYLVPNVRSADVDKLCARQLLVSPHSRAILLCILEFPQPALTRQPALSLLQEGTRHFLLKYMFICFY